MKDTRPINMLILTVFMIVLLGIAAAVGSVSRSQTVVDIHPAAINDSMNYSAVDSAQHSQWVVRPAVLRVFQTLNTLSAQMCQASPQTNPVQMVGGRFRMHSVKIHPWAVICSLQAA